MTATELGLITFRLSAVASMLAAGLYCAPDATISLPNAVFEYRGSQKNLSAARAAASEWNAVCGTRLSVVEPPATGDVVLAEVGSIEPGHGGATRYRDIGGKRAVRVEFIDSPHTKALLLHEMGHVLGKHHDESRVGVMNAVVSDSAVVVPEDCP